VHRESHELGVNLVLDDDVVEREVALVAIRAALEERAVRELVVAAQEVLEGG
jgi:hypothetical protein